MLHLLEMIYEYQWLRTKEERLSIPLEDDERARLIGLERLLVSEPPGREARRKTPRLPTPLPVQFTVPGGFGSGELRNVSGGGMAILTVRPPVVGTRTIVRIAEATTGMEYVFPARVVWRTMDARPAMGIAFDGVPSQAPFLAPTRGAWRRELRLGAARSTPISA